MKINLSHMLRQASRLIPAKHDLGYSFSLEQLADHVDQVRRGEATLDHFVDLYMIRPTRAETPQSIPSEREEIVALIDLVKILFPIVVNETPDYAELTFGEHQTQAMTMDPQTWLVLNNLFEHLSTRQAQEGSVK